MADEPDEQNVLGHRRSPVGELIVRLFACSPRELGLAAAVAVALTGLWLAVVPIIDPAVSGGDTQTYMAMAANPKAAAWAPLAFRGLVPWLAQSIGGEFHYLLAFRIISWGALAAAGLATYLICRRLGGEHRAALVGMAGLMCLPMWIFYIHQPYLIDAAAMALEAWSMLALLGGWFVALPLLLVVTGLARETVVGYALPMYMWLRSKWVDVGVAAKVFFLMAPAVVVVWAIKQPMLTTGASSMRDLIAVGLRVVQRDILPRPGYALYYSFAGSLGIWWLLGLYGRRYGGRFWWLLVPVFAQCLVGADYTRFLMFAFPIVVTAGAIAVWNHPRRMLLIAIVVVQSLAAVPEFVSTGRMRINSIEISSWITGALMVIVAIVLWWPRKRKSASSQDRLAGSGRRLGGHGLGGNGRTPTGGPDDLADIPAQ